jgi:Transposase DDE domain
MTTSKSPRTVATEALAVGEKVFPRFAHRCAPKIYTQPQLFTCLVLKSFFKTDYRGIAAILADDLGMRELLALKDTPHWTTLHKASKRLLRLPLARELLDSCVSRFMGRRKSVATAALDSTGFDAGHASRYYVRRRAKGQDKSEKPRQNTQYKRFAKLGVVVDCASHMILAAEAGRGPRPDVDRFVPLLEQALGRVGIHKALADAGYDSEPNHQFARQRCGVRSYMPATHGRRPKNGKLLSGRWRRVMARKLARWLGRYFVGYGQRWQVETVMSMLKRRQGSAVNGRSHWSRCRDLMLMVVTHNLMILANS